MNNYTVFFFKRLTEFASHSQYLKINLSQAVVRASVWAQGDVEINQIAKLNHTLFLDGHLYEVNTEKVTVACV